LPSLYVVSSYISFPLLLPFPSIYGKPSSLPWPTPHTCAKILIPHVFSVFNGSQDLVACIRAAHLCSWCHHDIWPSNIVIVENNVSLIDWDAAVEIGTQEAELHCANQAYTSSKILQCLHDEDQWSFVLADDMESLCYCFIMLCGSLPWLKIAEISVILKSRAKLRNSMYCCDDIHLLFLHSFFFSAPAGTRV